MARLVTEFGSLRIIDDSNAHIYARDADPGRLRGYQGRDYEKFPFGAMPWRNMPVPKIPRSQWQDRITEGNRLKLWSLHHSQARRVPILNQARTNYCWMNGVVTAIMEARAAAGMQTVPLSAASAAAPGKNYQNVGGWGGEAIEYIRRYGLVPQEFWPNDAIDRRYFEPTRQHAVYGVGQWWELPPNDFDAMMTCLILGFRVPIGLTWWGHLVCASAPVVIARNVYGAIITNSWDKDWENGGRAVLEESKATAAEQNCVTTPTLVDVRGEKLSGELALAL